MEVDEGCSEGVKAGGDLGDVLGWREEVGEELGGEASFFDFGEGLDGVGVEGYGEGGSFAELILHDTDGFIEGIDDEVGCSGVSDLADVSWVVIQGERDGSNYVGSNGERGPAWVQAQGEDELSAPGWAELVEGAVGAEDLGLGLIGIG